MSTKTRKIERKMTPNAADEDSEDAPTQSVSNVYRLQFKITDKMKNRTTFLLNIKTRPLTPNTYPITSAGVQECRRGRWKGAGGRVPPVAY